MQITPTSEQVVAWSAVTAQMSDAIENLRRSFTTLGESLSRVGRALKGLTEKCDSIALCERREEFGGNASDASRWPDQWQSVQCAAWLPDCPSDEHDLRCTGPRHH